MEVAYGATVSTDAATRLFNMLSAMKASNNNAAFKANLAAHLGLPGDAHVEIFVSVAALMGLPDVIEEQIRAHSELGSLADRYLLWKEPVTRAFAVLSPEQATQNFTAYYTDADVARLEMAALHLDRPTPPPALPADRLDEVRRLIDETRRLMADEPDPELRRFVDDLLRDIQQAIDLYAATGRDGLQDAIRRTVGAMVIRWPQGAPTAPSASKWYGPIFAVVLAVQALVGFGADAATAVLDVPAALEILSGEAEKGDEIIDAVIVEPDDEP